MTKVTSNPFVMRNVSTDKTAWSWPRSPPSDRKYGFIWSLRAVRLSERIVVQMDEPRTVRESYWLPADITPQLLHLLLFAKWATSYSVTLYFQLSWHFFWFPWRGSRRVQWHLMETALTRACFSMASRTWTTPTWASLQSNTRSGSRRTSRNTFGEKLGKEIWIQAGNAARDERNSQSHRFRMDKPFELTCLFWPCANLQFDVSGNMKKASTTFGRERWVMVWVCRLTIFTSINQQYFRMNSSLFIPGQTRRRCQPRWLWPSIDR